MALLKLLIFSALFYTAYARFPKSLQEKWGYLDTYESMGSRVVGGQNAADGDAPYQISLLQNYLNIFKSHICGGSIIAAQTVVTAAHCTDGQTPSDLIVRYGTNKRSTSQYPDKKVTRIVQHPQYNENTIENDISLLILDSAIQPSTNVQFIKITTTDLQGGTPVKVYGWGLTDGNSQSLPENLQVGNLKIVSNEECQAKWGDVNAVADSMICALDTTQQACNGDSGGPLVFENELVGVVSWGPAKCPPGEYMAVFTRPNSFQEWINANIV